MGDASSLSSSRPLLPMHEGHHRRALHSRQCGPPTAAVAVNCVTQAEHVSSARGDVPPEEGFLRLCKWDVSCSIICGRIWWDTQRISSLNSHKGGTPLVEQLHNKVCLCGRIFGSTQYGFICQRSSGSPEELDRSV